MGGLNAKTNQFVLLGLLVAILAGGCDRLGGGPGAEEREANFLAGRNLAIQGQKDKAVASFEQAILVNPSNAAAHLALGDLYHDQLSFINAAYHYNRYLQLLERRGQKPDVSAANSLLNCEMQLAIKYSQQISAQENDREIDALRRQLEEKNSLISRLQAELLQRSPTNEVPVRNTSLPADPGVPDSAGTAPREVVTPGTVGNSSGGTETARTSRTVTERNRPNSPSTPSTPATPRSHVVRPGETPYVIAKRYGVSVKSLMAANPGVSATRMRVGTTLRIPAP